MKIWSTLFLIQLGVYAGLALYFFTNKTGQSDFAYLWANMRPEYVIAPLAVLFFTGIGAVFARAVQDSRQLAKLGVYAPARVLQVLSTSNLNNVVIGSYRVLVTPYGQPSFEARISGNHQKPFRPLRENDWAVVRYVSAEQTARGKPLVQFVPHPPPNWQQLSKAPHSYSVATQVTEPGSDETLDTLFGSSKRLGKVLTVFLTALGVVLLCSQLDIHRVVPPVSAMPNVGTEPSHPDSANNQIPNGTPVDIPDQGELPPIAKVLSTAGVTSDNSAFVQDIFGNAASSSTSAQFRFINPVEVTAAAQLVSEHLGSSEFSGIIIADNNLTVALKPTNAKEADYYKYAYSTGEFSVSFTSPSSYDETVAIGDLDFTKLVELQRHAFTRLDQSTDYIGVEMHIFPRGADHFEAALLMYGEADYVELDLNENFDIVGETVRQF